MKLKLLVIDDSKLARMAVVKLLSNVAPEIERFEAANADEALAAFALNDPDVALVDYNMPGCDGLSLIAQLRELKPLMPVGVLSANYQAEVVNRARSMGATFLCKPLTEAALGEFLSDARRRSKVLGA